MLLPLQEIAKRHIELLRQKRQQKRRRARLMHSIRQTQQAFLQQCDDASCHDHDAPCCDICGQAGGGIVSDVEHADTASKCKCKVHTHCLEQWTAEHETKSKKMLVRRCPMCKQRRAGDQPLKRPRVCGHVMQGGGGATHCVLPLGHLGPHTCE